MRNPIDCSPSYSLWISKSFVHLFALHFISQKSSLHFHLLTNSRNCVSCSFIAHFTVFGKKFSFRRILGRTGDCTKHYPSLPFLSSIKLARVKWFAPIQNVTKKLSSLYLILKGSSRKFKNCVKIEIRLRNEKMWKCNWKIARMKLEDTIIITCSNYLDHEEI